MSRKVSIRIHYHRRSGLVGLLAVTLLMASFLAFLAWNQREVAASGSQTSFNYAQDRPFDHARDGPLAASVGLRGYYLTQSMYNGANADGTDGNGAGVCADGYHFASLWEILAPSNLKYDTDLGVKRDDSGQGPPSYLGGWVRTGYAGGTSSIPGWGNCNAWTSNDSGHSGAYIYLPRDWTAGGDIHVWEVSAPQCNLSGYVWCVADKVGTSVHLPLILRDSS
jgi:hypothetical protein